MRTALQNLQEIAVATSQSQHLSPWLLINSVVWRKAGICGDHVALQRRDRLLYASSTRSMHESPSAEPTWRMRGASNSIYTNHTVASAAASHNERSGLVEELRHVFGDHVAAQHENHPASLAGAYFLASALGLVLPCSPTRLASCFAVGYVLGTWNPSLALSGHPRHRVGCGPPHASFARPLVVEFCRPCLPRSLVHTVSTGGRTCWLGCLRLPTNSTD